MVKQSFLRKAVIDKALETAEINIVQSAAEPEPSPYAFENSVTDETSDAESDDASDAVQENTEQHIDGVLYYNSSMENYSLF